MRTNLVAGISLVLLVGCGSGEVAPPPSTVGGQTSAGATVQGGSAATSGGTSSTSSGNNPTGGTTVGMTGGTSSAVGGTTAASSSAAGGTKANTGGGGTKAAGGASAATGGTKAAGGASAATGGTKAAGGASAATGGTKAAGGASAATGGTPEATGGTKAEGGASAATGGTKAAGGSSAAGGAATGGTTTAAGGAATFKCDNLSLAPNTTGSKPTGAAGGLTVLDWAGFKGAVSFTFDDNMTTGSYSKFKATGAHVTLFVTAAMSNYAGYTGAPAAGDEIGNHTTTHTSSGNTNDFQTMQATIQSSYGVTAYTGASPNGDASWVTPSKSFFIANRGVSEADIAARSATVDLFNLPAYIPTSGAGAKDMGTHIKSGIWKVFCVHGWASPAYNPISESEMLSTMTTAVSGGYWTESMENVAAYFLGQRGISASSTTNATWTLPAHFPPNMCVRITTTGGTVTQKGAEVPWDSHGYYQISLDALEVTVK
jgi:hypothetical protein